MYSRANKYPQSISLTTKTSVYPNLVVPPHSGEKPINKVREAWVHCDVFKPCCSSPFRTILLQGPSFRFWFEEAQAKVRMMTNPSANVKIYRRGSLNRSKWVFLKAFSTVRDFSVTPPKCTFSEYQFRMDCEIRFPNIPIVYCSSIVYCSFCVAAEQLCSNPWRNTFVELKIWDHRWTTPQTKMTKIGGWGEGWEAAFARNALGAIVYNVTWQPGSRLLLLAGLVPRGGYMEVEVRVMSPRFNTADMSSRRVVARVQYPDPKSRLPKKPPPPPL